MLTNCNVCGGLTVTTDLSVCRASKHQNQKQHTRTRLVHSGVRKHKQCREIPTFDHSVSIFAFSGPKFRRIAHRLCPNSPWEHRNSRAANWSPSKQRFLDFSRQSREVPGPGTYNPSDIDSTQGSYVVSNFRNTGNVKFIKPSLPDGGMRSRTPIA